jgi:hypothetical protein
MTDLTCFEGRREGGGFRRVSSQWPAGEKKKHELRQKIKKTKST